MKLAMALIIFLMLLHPAGARYEDGMPVVPAQEILDKIERGEPVEYDHVIVEGDLDLGRLELPKRHVDRTDFEVLALGLSEDVMLVSSAIRLTDSAINGNTSFSNARFINSVDLSDSRLNGTANFRYSTFNGNAYFRGSAFNGTADFGGSDFNGNADFQDSDFNGTANFQDSDFNGYAYFGGSDFNGYAYFGGSDFNISDFSSVEFNKQVYFNDANFSNSTSFNSSRFKEDPLFEGALFDGPLYLTRAKYDRLYIRWKNIKELGYDDAAYLSLLENFKRLGYVEDYDACYYEYRRLHRDQPWSGKYHALHPTEEWLRKRIDLGLQVFYGYGKKPIWPLLWSGGAILLFGLIWRRAGVDGGKCRGGIFERFGPSGERNGKISLEEELRALGGAMLFSATLFLSGTRLFVDPPSMPKLEGWLAAHARGFFIAERVLGAFFSILFFLAISGTVVR